MCLLVPVLIMFFEYFNFHFPILSMLIFLEILRNDENMLYKY